MIFHVDKINRIIDNLPLVWTEIIIVRGMRTIMCLIINHLYRLSAVCLPDIGGQLAVRLSKSLWHKVTVIWDRFSFLSGLGSERKDRQVGIEIEWDPFESGALLNLVIEVYCDTMIVKGKLLYHLHRKNRHSEEWQVGNTIETPKGDNYFRKLRHADFYRIKHEIGRDEPYMDRVLSELDEAKNFVENAGALPDFLWPRKGLQMTKDLIRLSTDLQDSLVVYIRFLTEIVFESERKQNFEDLPCRRNGVWLTDKTGLKKWFTVFRRLNEKPLSEFQVFQVRVSGIMHKGDGSWVTPDIYPVEHLYERASRYWRGEVHEDKRRRLIEYLFEGKLEVLEELNVEDFL